MEYLTKYGIEYKPLARNNLDEALKVVMQAFIDNPIIKDKIQTFQELSENTRDVMTKCLEAEQQINQRSKTNLNFGAVYYLKQQIVSVVMACDLIQFLNIVKNSKPDLLFEPFKHLNYKSIENKKCLYIGKSIVSPNLKAQGLAKYFLLQVLRNLHKNGYTCFYGINSNIRTNKIMLRFGGQVLNDSFYQLGNGRQLRLTFMICDFDKFFKTQQISAKL